MNINNSSKANISVINERPSRRSISSSLSRSLHLKERPFGPTFDRQKNTSLCVAQGVSKKSLLGSVKTPEKRDPLPSAVIQHEPPKLKIGSSYNNFLKHLQDELFESPVQEARSTTRKLMVFDETPLADLNQEALPKTSCKATNRGHRRSNNVDFADILKVLNSLDASEPVGTFSKAKPHHRRSNNTDFTSVLKHLDTTGVLLPPNKSKRGRRGHRRSNQMDFSTVLPLLGEVKDNQPFKPIPSTKTHHRRAHKADFVDILQKLGDVSVEDTTGFI